MNLKKISVSVAALSDIPGLEALVNGAYRGNHSRRGWTTEADFLDGQRTDRQTLADFMSAAKEHKILIVRESQEILASVCIEKHGEDTCYLGMLTVAPEMQNRGLGKILLEAAEQEARAWGATHMTISVIQLRKELIAWYKRCGYKETGEREPFPYGQPKFGIPKRDDLYFEVFRKPLSL